MSSRVRPREIISTCVQYSNWLISSASASSPSCSAASHTSPASSRIFLPSPCTPPSSAATVPLPAGRVRARSLSSANRASKVFTARDCSTPRRASHGGFATTESVPGGMRLVVVHLAMHVFQMHALGFLYPLPDERERQQRAHRVEAVGGAQVIAQPGERNGDQPVGDPLARRGKAEGGCSDAVGEHLTQQHPHHRPPRHAKRNHEEIGGNQGDRTGGAGKDRHQLAF